MTYIYCDVAFGVAAMSLYLSFMIALNVVNKCLKTDTSSSLCFFTQTPGFTLRPPTHNTLSHVWPLVWQPDSLECTHVQRYLNIGSIFPHATALCREQVWSKMIKMTSVGPEAENWGEYIGWFGYVVVVSIAFCH